MTRNERKDAINANLATIATVRTTDCSITQPRPESSSGFAIQRLGSTPKVPADCVGEFDARRPRVGIYGSEDTVGISNGLRANLTEVTAVCSSTVDDRQIM